MRDPKHHILPDAPDDYDYDDYDEDNYDPTEAWNDDLDCSQADAENYFDSLFDD